MPRPQAQPHRPAPQRDVRQHGRGADQARADQDHSAQGEGASPGGREAGDPVAQRNDLHARRLALSQIRDEAQVNKLFDVIGPRYADRPGGYTRVLKAGFRHGDNARDGDHRVRRSRCRRQGPGFRPGRCRAEKKPRSNSRREYVEKFGRAVREGRPFAFEDDEMINRSMVIAGVIGGLVSLAGYQIVSNTSQPSMAQPSTKTVPLSAPSMKALPQAATAVPQSAAQVQLTFAPIVKRVAPAVVNVYSRSVVQPAGQSAVRRSAVPAVLRRLARNAPARAAVAGLRRDRARRRRDPHQQPRHRGRPGHRGGAGRQARIQGAACCWPTRAPISPC